MTSNEFLKKIKFAVLSVDDKADIILFGSRARGDHKKDSDWDILVLTNKEVDVAFQNDIRDKLYTLELEHDQPVSSIIVDRKQWNKMSITGFYENVTKEGVAL